MHSKRAEPRVFNKCFESRISSDDLTNSVQYISADSLSKRCYRDKRTRQRTRFSMAYEPLSYLRLSEVKIPELGSISKSSQQMSDNFLLLYADVAFFLVLGEPLM